MVFINITKKEVILYIIIIVLAIGWIMAVYNQYTTTNKVKELYNHLVGECNKIIGVQEKKDFCIYLPDGTTQCNQNDLNLFYSFG